MYITGSAALFGSVAEGSKVACAIANQSLRGSALDCLGHVARHSQSRGCRTVGHPPNESPRSIVFNTQGVVLHSDDQQVQKS